MDHSDLDLVGLSIKTQVTNLRRDPTKDLVEVFYIDPDRNVPTQFAVELPSAMSRVLVAALERYIEDNAGPAVPVNRGQEQVMVRHRSLVVWDDGTSSTIEIGPNDQIRIHTGHSRIRMHFTPQEASRFANAIATALGHSPFKAQRDCVHCQADMIHDKHETAAEQADRGRTLMQSLRAQRVKLNGAGTGTPPAS